MKSVGASDESTVTSCDGYIRMSLKRLALLQFVHVISACDKTLLAELLADAVPAGAAGYTEWISKTAPFVSLGWDWYRDDVSRHCLLITNQVRRNIMLVDSQGRDLGTRRTTHFITSWLGALEWQSVVFAASIHA